MALRPRHPLITVGGPTAVGLLGGVTAAVALDVYTAGLDMSEAPLLAVLAQQPWQSFNLGLVLGTIAGGAEAIHLRQHRGHFIDIAFLGAEERRSPSARRVNLGAWLPTVVALVASPLAAAWFEFSILVAPLAALIPVALTFPEEYRIYRAVKRRMSQGNASP